METKLSSKSKFTLFNLLAQPRAYYRVEEIQPNVDSSSKVQQASHHIIIVDRSGSMWSDIEALKEMLLKQLTITEFASSSMAVSLISYSSSGDCVLHFDHVPIKDVMASNSPYQKEIKKIRSSGMTCISQALTMAKPLIRADELTGITLHSDGYANHPSPSSEYREVESLCEEIKKGNVFINTIAYSSYSDFKFLSKTANSVSGKCVKADSSKEVYDAFVDTANALCGNTVPALLFEQGDADYQVFVSWSMKRVNGSAGDLKITGVSKDDDVKVYRYRKVSKDQYESPSSTKEDHHSLAILALSAASLAEGNINLSKFALFSSCREALAKKHYRAITGVQLAEMAKDVQGTLFGTLPDLVVDKPKSIGGKTSILDVVNVLEKNLGDIRLNLDKMLAGYKRRSLKRIEGVRLDNGTVEKPWLETKVTEESPYVKIASFEINRSSPTIQLKIIRPVNLVKVADGSVISEVAGIKVDSLSTFNNYTIVGDGEVNVPSLHLKVLSPQVAMELISAGAVCDTSSGDMVIPLAEMPVCPLEFNSKPSDLAKTFNGIAKAKTVASILSAIRGKDSAKYTPDQIAQLKTHYLSPALNISFPTTNDYTDLDKAINEGSVDTRTVFNVDIGSTQIVNMGSIMSANAFLKRMYEAVDAVTGKKKDEDPSFSMFGKGVAFKEKKLSAKVKVTPSDVLQKEIFDDFLGIKKSGVVNDVLKNAGIDADVESIKMGGRPSLEAAEKSVDSYINDLYRKEIVPLAFYIGATGLLPDGMEAKAETAESVQKQCPSLKLGKDEKDGTFFRFGDALITVYATTEYYSTGKVVAEKEKVPVSS